MKSVTGLVKSLRQAKANEKGFTLIELIIVIAIIGILVAIAIPVYGAIQESAKSRTMENLAKDGLDSVVRLAGERSVDIKSGPDGAYLIPTDSGSSIRQDVQDEYEENLGNVGKDPFAQDVNFEIQLRDSDEAGYRRICVGALYIKGVDLTNPNLSIDDFPSGFAGGDQCVADLTAR